MTRKSALFLTTAALGLTGGAAWADSELNALVWCDHTDPSLIEPFEAAHNDPLGLMGLHGSPFGQAAGDGDVTRQAQCQVEGEGHPPASASDKSTG